MADTIYWTTPYDYEIRGAPLAGGTVDTLYDSAQDVNLPMGLAIDPTAGRIYWANYGDSTIRSAPLTAGGNADELYGPADGVSDPFGVAIDPAAGQIYWTNGEWSTAGVAGTIRRARLDGGGAVVDLYGVAQGVGRPLGVAIDRAAGRIYWANGATGEIWRAPLTPGSGGPVGPLYGPPQVIGPQWLAIDPAAGRIYCSHWNYPQDGRIRGAPLAGGGPVDTLYDSARGVSFPGGLAIDPNPAGAPERLEVATVDRLDLGGWARGAWDRIRDVFSRDVFTPSPPARIYWGNGVTRTSLQPGSPHDKKIQSAPLAGTGPVDTLYGPANWTGGPSALAVLRAPVGTGPPVISWALVLPDEFSEGMGGGPGGWQFGGGNSGPVGQRLSCSRGSWTPDLSSAFLYRAPQSFAYQWRLNGADIGGANAPQYTATAPGSYTCRVTASNQAGSAAQTSSAMTVS
jgi:DNA-binding beta-propeller fold protein YncE